MSLSTQGLDFGSWILGIEHGRPGNEHIRSGLGCSKDGLPVNASIDLEQNIRARGVDSLADFPDFRQCAIEEPLSPEARLHGHNQDHVKLFYEVQVGTHFGCRSESHCGTGTSFAYTSSQSYGGGYCLSVEGNRGGTRACVLDRPSVWILNHEVSIYRQSPVADCGFNHRQSPRQIGNKVPIHYVNVNQVGIGDAVEFLVQSSNVAREYRGGNLYVHPPRLSFLVEIYLRFSNAMNMASVP